MIRNYILHVHDDDDSDGSGGGAGGGDRNVCSMYSKWHSKREAMLDANSWPKRLPCYKGAIPPQMLPEAKHYMKLEAGDLSLGTTVAANSP